MLGLSILFFLLAIVAAVFGFGGLSDDFMDIGRILFVIFLVLFVISLIYALVTGRRPPPPID